ncbi:MAG: hypothetical protein M1832_006140 [Thelocarpon impressellum]|nr:MAG: hypothetical protein M1832_006140 [Thelocarpon impressellum]
MALQRLSNPGNAAKLLDKDIVLLRGSATEASSVSVKGTLVLCLTEPLSLKRISLSLLGTSKISWPDPQATSRLALSKTIKDVSDFHTQNWVLLDLAKTRSDSLAVGNYEYPFEVVFPGDARESVEGLDDAWVIWRMKASIERGLLAQNVHARKHVRLVRTLEPTALEPFQSPYVENDWPEKVSYSVSTASKAVVFGSPIDFKMCMVPLAKGVRIGRIEARLVERLQFSLTAKTHQLSRDVAQMAFDCDVELTSTAPDGLDAWLLSKSLAMPNSLLACMQDVDVLGIRIEHRLKITVDVLNPDGHTSVVRVKIPVVLYISPHATLDERNQISSPVGQAVQAHSALDPSSAPPLYGEHTFDQLWSDIDPSGYTTPVEGSSPVNSPGARSRNASYESLAALGAPALHDHGVMAAQALRQRLTDLHDPNATRQPRSLQEASQVIGNMSMTPISRTPDQDSRSRASPTGHGQGAPTRAGLTPPRLGSGERSPTAPAPDYDPATLSKVPSYQTAVRTPAGTPVRHDLPDYAAAVGSAPVFAAPRSPPYSPDETAHIDFADPASGSRS